MTALVSRFIARLMVYMSVCTVLGAALGSYLSTFNAHDADRIAFWWRPVVEMRGDVVEGPKDNYVLIHMYGEKLRGEECEYRGVQAFGDRIVGAPVDLRMLRIDTPEQGATKPAGRYDIGVWRVWPVDAVPASP